MDDFEAARSDGGEETVFFAAEENDCQAEQQQQQSPSGEAVPWKRAEDEEEESDCPTPLLRLPPLKATNVDDEDDEDEEEEVPIPTDDRFCCTCGCGVALIGTESDLTGTGSDHANVVAVDEDDSDDCDESEDEGCYFLSSCGTDDHEEEHVAEVASAFSSPASTVAFYYYGGGSGESKHAVGSVERRSFSSSVDSGRSSDSGTLKDQKQLYRDTLLLQPDAETSHRNKVTLFVPFTEAVEAASSATDASAASATDNVVICDKQVILRINCHSSEVRVSGADSTVLYDDDDELAAVRPFDRQPSETEEEEEKNVAAQAAAEELFHRASASASAAWRTTRNNNNQGVKSRAICRSCADLTRECDRHRHNGDAAAAISYRDLHHSLASLRTSEEDDEEDEDDDYRVIADGPALQQQTPEASSPSPPPQTHLAEDDSKVTVKETSYYAAARVPRRKKDLCKLLGLIECELDTDGLASAGSNNAASVAAAGPEEIKLAQRVALENLISAIKEENRRSEERSPSVKGKKNLAKFLGVEMEHVEQIGKQQTLPAPRRSRPAAKSLLKQGLGSLVSGGHEAAAAAKTSSLKSTVSKDEKSLSSTTFSTLEDAAAGNSGTAQRGHRKNLNKFLGLDDSDSEEMVFISNRKCKRGDACPGPECCSCGAAGGQVSVVGIRIDCADGHDVAQEEEEAAASSSSDAEVGLGAVESGAAGLGLGAPSSAFSSLSSSQEARRAAFINTLLRRHDQQKVGSLTYSLSGAGGGRDSRKGILTTMMGGGSSKSAAAASRISAAPRAKSASAETRRKTVAFKEQDLERRPASAVRRRLRKKDAERRSAEVLATAQQQQRFHPHRQCSNCGCHRSETPLLVSRPAASETSLLAEADWLRRGDTGALIASEMELRRKRRRKKRQVRGGKSDLDDDEDDLDEEGYYVDLRSASSPCLPPAAPLLSCDPKGRVRFPRGRQALLHPDHLVYYHKQHLHHPHGHQQGHHHGHGHGHGHSHGHGGMPVDCRDLHQWMHQHHHLQLQV